MKFKYMVNQSDTVKAKAIDFINTYYPELMPDIKDYARKNNTDIGNIAAITIKDIICPILEDEKRGIKG